MKGEAIKVFCAFEKRDWGAGRATWRRVPEQKTRRRRAKGPSVFAMRRAPGRLAKRLNRRGAIALYT